LKLLKFLEKKHIQTISEEKKTLTLSNILLGKNVLITGAGRNIGRSIALEMAQVGANIFYTNIDFDCNDQLEKELAKYPVISRGFVSDISKHDDIISLRDSLLNDNIKIDILVNNAGISLYQKIERKFNIDRLHKLFDTNIIGPVHLTNLISQMMINNNIAGSIIFITSIHQWQVFLDEGYSPSKAAIGMIIKEFAVELAQHNIRVNGIAPGNIIQDKEGINIPHKYTPLYKSSINPCFIGRAAVYLSSDYFSKYTTGTVIKIDGGLSLYNHLVDKNMGR
jgi:NAD(P)-dependent dehydrogenase (short-subunit alcohol dehydrogenase family)